MTTRERKERKAERLREWAGTRQDKAATLQEGREHYRGDIAFWTQPGHIPARSRIYEQMDKAHEHGQKAAEMSSRADGIEAQLNRSIYDDDPDAIERLEEKIAKLEERTELQKAINKAWRKGPAALAALNLSDKLIETMTETMERCPWLKVPCDTTHDRAEIRRCKQRVAKLSNPVKSWRVLTVKYAGDCDVCDQTIERGETALYCKADRIIRHQKCHEGAN